MLVSGGFKQIQMDLFWSRFSSDAILLVSASLDCFMLVSGSFELVHIDLFWFTVGSDGFLIFSAGQDWEVVA